MEFSAFIITFERPAILQATIKVILKQTKQPEKLLIIDNSITDETQSLFNHALKNDPRLSYYRVGYNSGAAGGAYFGLKILSELGYQYIQWLDDDDPPVFDDITETLFKLFDGDKNIGIVGQVGARFSKITGRLGRFNDSELNGDSPLEVDYIGGGQLMIVKSDVVRKGCFPDKDMFFGFEDLSFCLKAKSKGFKIVVSKKLFLKLRIKANRIGQIKLGSKPSWRDYYSSRSLVYICLYERRIILPLLFILAKVLVGLLYREQFRFIQLLGFFHGVLGKKGIVVLPKAKNDKQ